jgi:hypothetical protein
MSTKKPSSPFGTVAMAPFALRPHDAAEALGISKSSLDKLVKDGKIRPPIAPPGMNIRLFSVERLRQDWQSLLEEAENGSDNPWDAA